MTPSVLHAACFASPNGGNFIASMKALSQECLQNGLRLVLILPPRAKERPWCKQWIEEGRAIYFVPDTLTANAVQCGLSLAKIAKRENAVILHSHFSQYDVPAWLAKVQCGVCGRKLHVFWHFHSDFPIKQTLLRSLKDVLKFRIMGRSSKIIAVSEKTVEPAIAAGFPLMSLQVVHNGVDFDRIASLSHSREEVLTPLQLEPDTQIVLLFGWTPIVKGVDIAMEAVQHLAEQGQKIVLAAVGRDKMLEFIRERVGETIPPWLRILSPVENIADLYQIADVFLSPSRNEGFSYAACEAMAYGIPCILSDIPGVAWAKQTPAAVFFPSGDIDKLADALRDVLKWPPERRAEITASGSEYVRSHYDVRQWADQIMRQYHDCLGHGDDIATSITPEKPAA